MWSEGTDNDLAVGVSIRRNQVDRRAHTQPAERQNRAIQVCRLNGNSHSIELAGESAASLCSRRWRELQSVE